MTDVREAERRVLKTCRYFMRDRVQADERRRARAYSSLFDAMQDLEATFGHSATEEYR